MANQDFDPDWNSPPGDTIDTILGERHIPIPTFAEKMNESDEWVMQLIDGKISITQEIADKLSNILGAPAAFWIRREKFYQQKKADMKSLAGPYPYQFVSGEKVQQWHEREDRLHKYMIERTPVLGESLTGIIHCDYEVIYFVSNNDKLELKTPSAVIVDTRFDCLTGEITIKYNKLISDTYLTVSYEYNYAEETPTNFPSPETKLRPRSIDD